MLLSEEDISRLEKQGHTQGSFVRFDNEGYALLRNRQGYCVFYNSAKRRCEVYVFRPSGCRVYPVIQDEDATIIMDPICKAQDSVKEREKRLKGKKVTQLLKKIDHEAEERRSK